MAGQVPVGDVHVLEAQDAHLELLAAHIKGHDLVGSHIGLLGLNVDVVGAEGVHRGAGVLVGGIGQHIIENLLGLHVEVELVVAGDEGVVADVAQADGHGVVHAALHVHVVADDGTALDDVAVVDEDGAVHGGPLFLHGGGHLQVAVLDFLAVDGVEVVALSVHVGGGVDAKGEGIVLGGEGGDAGAADQHDSGQGSGRHSAQGGVMLFHVISSFPNSDARTSLGPFRLYSFRQKVTRGRHQSGGFERRRRGPLYRTTAGFAG